MFNERATNIISKTAFSDKNAIKAKALISTVNCGSRKQKRNTMY